MKILVTGGAGYIGSHSVKELLKSGYKSISVVDDLSTGYKKNIPKEINFIESDFGDEGFLNTVSKSKYDAVIHFAASKLAPESVSEPLKYYRNNVSKSIALLEVALKSGAKYFIFSSSAAVYGNVAKFPITEKFSTKPTNPYGWSKLMFEQILKDGSRAYDFQFVSLRYFNAGGADPDGKLGNNHKKGEDLISVLMRTATSNDDFQIFGSDYKTKDGTCIRDIIHVTDLAKAHVLALDYLFKGGSSEILNLGSEAGFSVKEIAEKTQKITKSKFKIKYGPRRAGDIAVSIASSKKAKEVLKWQQKESKIENIIKTAWNWELSSQDKQSGQGSASRG